jgi:hypothetical protein
MRDIPLSDYIKYTKTDSKELKINEIFENTTTMLDPTLGRNMAGSMDKDYQQ